MLAANLYPTRAQSFPLAKILGTRLEVSCNQLNFFLSIRSGLHGYLIIVTSEQPGTIYWLPTGSTSHSMWIDLLLIYPIYRKRSGVFYFRFSITDELKQIRQPQPYPPPPKPQRVYRCKRHNYLLRKKAILPYTVHRSFDKTYQVYLG